MTAPVVIHQHTHEARPVSITSEDGAQRWLDMPHKRHTYKLLGVPIAELPNGRFAVLLEDVERAIRERGRAVVTAPQPTDDVRTVLERAGLRMVK